MRSTRTSAAAVAKQEGWIGIWGKYTESARGMGSDTGQMYAGAYVISVSYVVSYFPPQISRTCIPLRHLRRHSRTVRVMNAQIS